MHAGRVLTPLIPQTPSARGHTASAGACLARAAAAALVPSSYVARSVACAHAAVARGRPLQKCHVRVLAARPKARHAMPRPWTNLRLLMRRNTAYHTRHPSRQACVAVPGHWTCARHLDRADVATRRGKATLHLLSSGRISQVSTSLVPHRGHPRQLEVCPGFGQGAAPHPSAE